MQVRASLSDASSCLGYSVGDGAKTHSKRPAGGSGEHAEAFSGSAQGEVARDA